MSKIVSKITSLTIVNSTVYSSKPCVTGLCAGNSPVTGEFPAQMSSNAVNISMWWRHNILFTMTRLWWTHSEIGFAQLTSINVSLVVT